MIHPTGSIGDLAVRLLRASNESLPAVIDEVLGVAAAAAGADRAQIWMPGARLETVRVAHSWHRAGVPVLDFGGVELDLGAIPYFAERVLAGRTLRVGSRAEMGPYEKMLFERVGSHAVMVIPLFVADRYAAFLNVARLTEGPWRDDDETLLGTVGSLIISATHRRDTELALRAAEHRIRVLAEASADAIHVVRPDGTVLFTTSSFERMFGVSGESLIGTAPWELVHPDDRAALVELLASRPAPGGAPMSTTFRLQHADGSWRLVEAVGRDLVDDPEIGGYVSTLRDVTERESAREAQRAEQRRFRVLTDASADVVLCVDASGAISYASPSCERVLGLSASELVGRARWDIVHPDDVADGLAFMAKVAESTDGYRTHVGRVRHADGTYRTMEYVARNLLADPDVKAIVLTLGDITERQRVEAALRASEARFRAVIENAPIGVAVCDALGACTFLNDELARIYGMTREEALGNGYLRAVHPDDADDAVEKARRVSRDGEVLDRQTRYVHADGRVVHAHARLIRMLTATGERELFGFVEDLTARREAAAAREKLLLSERLASVGSLAAAVAHEINNPLTYVQGNIDASLESLGRLSADRTMPFAVRAQLDEALALLRESRQGCDQVRDVVRDVKVLSRAEDPAKERVELQLAIESAVRMTANEVRHRARLDLRIAPALPDVFGNASRLAQVFVNLLLHAAHSTPEGDAEHHTIGVDVRAEATTGAVVVVVTDQGAGIAPSMLPRVFDPFFTTQTEGFGTGLGLAVSRSIVEEHGGTLSLESAPGRGTTVRVSLPALAPATPEPVAPAVATPPRRARILVVDDEPLVGRAISRLLALEHEVETCVRAEDALAKLRSGARFDVVLCDVMMPQMSGEEFHQVVAAEWPELRDRIVYMTGGAFTPRARAFLDSLTVAPLEKPVRVPELRELIRTLLG